MVGTTMDSMIDSFMNEAERSVCRLLTIRTSSHGRNRRCHTT